MKKGPAPDEVRAKMSAATDRVDRLPFVQDGFEEPLPFVRAVDLPDIPVAYLFDGLLPLPGTSLVAGAPKAGKSYWARCLAMAAARCSAYMGRRMSAERRPVLLVSLEDTAAQIREHFSLMGISEADNDLFVYIPEFTAPKDIAARLAVTVDELRPGLVIVDTIQKLLRIGDVNDYGAVVTAVEPLVTLARATDSHVMCLHHTRKSGGAGGTEILGSTGFGGGFDTTLMLKCGEDGTRSIYSRNRSGEALPETVLQLDEDGWIRTTGTKADAEARDLEQDVLDHIGTQDKPMGADEVIAALGLGRNPCKAALDRLVQDGLLKREGEGRRGSKFLYSVLDPIGMSTEYRNGNW